jgi:hypothetical protein
LARGSRGLGSASPVAQLGDAFLQDGRGALLQGATTKEAAMPENKTYSGSCHCGNVRYEVTTDLAKVMQCNCSLCSRAGYLLTFVPASQFKLLSGEDAVQDYRFNKHVIAHVFCKTCGVRSFAKGKDRAGNEVRAINVRCLEGVEPDSITITKVDGRSL